MKHNSSKMKVSIEYIKKMLGDEGLSENLGNMVRIVHAENIDIRSLNNLKRTLLDSKKIENNLLPLQEYHDIRNQIYKGQPLKIEEMLLREVLVNENQIDVPKLVEVIDICNFFPIKVKKIKNKSSDIYQVLSSNTRDTYNAKEASNGGLEPDLANNLEIIWSILHQKFKNVGKAFHFFDMDDNRSIDFIEFFSGLDKLRIKISENDAYKCF